MDQRTFQRYDRFLYHVGHNIREQGFAGVVATSQWQDGKPKPHATPVQARRATKRLVPLPQPHSTRERPGARLLLAHIDPDIESAVRSITRFDDELKKFVILAWVRGSYTSIQDLCVILNLSSRQVSKRKAKVFNSLEVVL